MTVLLLLFIVNVICHRFPNPRIYMDRLKTWMKIVGLENEDPYTVYAKKYICSIHFMSNCTSPGTKRLNANDYPSINLSGMYNLYFFDTMYTIYLHIYELLNYYYTY